MILSKDGNFVYFDSRDFILTKCDDCNATGFIVLVHNIKEDEWMLECGSCGAGVLLGEREIQTIKEQIPLYNI